MKKVKTALTTILIVAILALTVGFFMTFYNPKTKQVSRFYLQYDKQVITDMTEITFAHEIVELKARHTFAFAESDTSFTVTIVPNTEHDFTFHVGEVGYKFSEIEDLTSAFNIELTEDGFTLDLTQTNMQNVLGKLFLTPVSLPAEFSNNRMTERYFKLQATSANGGTVAVNFNVNSPVTDVRLTPNEEVLYF